MTITAKLAFNLSNFYYSAFHVHCVFSYKLLFKITYFLCILLIVIQFKSLVDIFLCVHMCVCVCFCFSCYRFLSYDYPNCRTLLTIQKGLVHLFFFFSFTSLYLHSALSSLLLFLLLSCSFFYFSFILFVL